MKTYYANNSTNQITSQESQLTSYNSTNQITPQHSTIKINGSCRSGSSPNLSTTTNITFVCHLFICWSQLSKNINNLRKIEENA